MKNISLISVTNRIHISILFLLFLFTLKSNAQNLVFDDKKGEDFTNILPDNGVSFLGSVTDKKATFRIGGFLDSSKRAFLRNTTSGKSQDNNLSLFTTTTFNPEFTSTFDFCWQLKPLITTPLQSKNIKGTLQENVKSKQGTDFNSGFTIKSVKFFFVSVGYSHSLTDFYFKSNVDSLKTKKVPYDGISFGFAYTNLRGIFPNPPSNSNNRSNYRLFVVNAGMGQQNNISDLDQVTYEKVIFVDSLNVNSNEPSYAYKSKQLVYGDYKHFWSADFKIDYMRLFNKHKPVSAKPDYFSKSKSTNPACMTCDTVFTFNADPKPEDIYSVGYDVFIRGKNLINDERKLSAGIGLVIMKNLDNYFQTNTAKIFKAKPSFFGGIGIVWEENWNDILKQTSKLSLLPGLILNTGIKF